MRVFGTIAVMSLFCLQLQAQTEGEVEPQTQEDGEKPDDEKGVD